MEDRVTDDPVDLDDRRGMAAQKATAIRREQLRALGIDQEALRRSEEELESLLLAAPAETWREASAKAEYLIRLFATTAPALDPRRQALIANVLEDFSRLCDREKTST